MDALPIFAAIVASVGVAGLLFALFLLVPLGAPTVHLVDPRRAPARPARERLHLIDAVPIGYVAWIERRIVFAGRSEDWTAARFLLIKVAVAVPAVLIGVAFISADPVPFRVLIGGFGILLALIAPEVVLSSRADDRRKAIQLALPDTLDQMTIAVEAGLSFDAAMARAAANGKGPLAEEMTRTLHDVAIGQSRTEAYRSLERRTNSEDLRRFVRAIVQADQYGISVADVLRVQASEMRIKRRQRAEEQAVKIPVKIVFPLVFCILPVLFIVLLTPAVIGIFNTFAR